VKALFDPAPWWLVLAGWSVIVALWHTSVVALAFAAWRLWRRSAPATTQYRAASGALALAAVFTLATPAALLLRGRATPPRVEVSMVGSPLQPMPGGPTTGGRTQVPPIARWGATARGFASIVAPWIGAAWCLGFAIGLVRLSGGWGLAQWIRRRAIAVRSPDLVDAAAAVSTTWGLPPATLLASAHVEAPVVIGARAPAVLLPIDLEQRLDAQALPPLLAHELAHVDRRDYAANLLQSLADTPLFFSPGARWLSRSVRDAREYCCDDIVAAHYGAGAYVSALTTLARLGVVARARPAVNAAGPRLIVRIRRLLQEDAMTPFAGYRLAALVGSLALVAAAGTGVVPLSAAAMAGVGGTVAPARAAARGAEADIPIGFMTSQPGAALRLRDMQRTEAGLCGIAEIENLATVSITGVRFAAFAYAPVLLPRSNLFSASFATSELLAADVAPQQIATMDVGLLTRDEARERLRTPHATIMCAVAEIRYANGARWEMPPATVFGPDRAEIPRALLGGDPVAGAPICRDQTGGEYSDGAVVPIALEPGAFARCHEGAWSEYQLPRMQPDPAR
jgi:beta-lactamase regulating signal transducer with metallopeptidase domain